MSDLISSLTGGLIDINSWIGGSSTDGSKQQADSILAARYIVTVREGATTAAECVLLDHALVVRGGRIIAVLPKDEAFAQYATEEFVDMPEAALMPGLVNMHSHLGMSMLRGFADDLCLSDWLMHHIWPAEGKFVSAEFVRDGAALGLVEMVRGGTTCVNDMYFFNESLLVAARAAGVRVTAGLVLLDFPTAYAPTGPDEYLAKAEALVKATATDAESLIRFSAAPHAPYTVCDANLTRVKEFADANGLPVHIHLHETHSEVADSESGNKTAMACHRSDTPARPFANLDRLGLVDERLIAVHMTQLSADEIARCGEARVNVVHCPSSNLKLASGMCPIARLHAAGANVCIGTDSTASNNTLDMWGEMRLAALLAKAVSADPTAVPALTALRMATINGARALGLGDRCGSLEVGKACDAIAVDLSAAEFAPMYDVVSHLVYVADRRAVTDVWCAGARLMRNRRLVTVNEAEVVRAAREWQSQITAHRDEAARAAREASEAASAGAQQGEHGQEAAASASEVAAAEEK